MKRLLQIEWHKFKHSKSSKTLTSIYIIIAAASLFIGIIPFDFGTIKGSISDLGVFNFPVVWHVATYCISFLKIFIAIVIVSLTASEYSNRTLKQNLIDGLSKKELILSKFYLAGSLAIIVTTVVFIVSLILGLIYSDYDEVSIIFSQMEYLPAFLLSHLLLFCFCLFAGIFVKRSAFALGFIGIWWIFEGVLNIMGYIYDAKHDTNIYEHLGYLLPMNAMSNLIDNPFPKISIVKETLNLVPGNGLEFEFDVEWIHLLSACLWSFLFIYLSYLLLKKRDL
jgi:ABC-type transport system involved in multi-copper enzyme maturation permease subunit